MREVNPKMSQVPFTIAAIEILRELLSGWKKNCNVGNQETFVALRYR